jgi:tetratricopeptide (TPR) repeat protein
MTRPFSSCILALGATLAALTGSAIAASPTAGAAPAGQERVEKLEARVQALEGALEFQKGVIASVPSVSDTAKTTLDHTKRMFEQIQWILGGGAAFFALLGFLGYRRAAKGLEVSESEARAAVAEAREAIRDVRGAEQTFRNQVAELGKLGEEMNRLATNIQVDALGQRRASEAYTHVIIAEAESDATRRRKSLRQAVASVDSFLQALRQAHSGAPSKQVLAQVYWLKAYALKRLEDYEDAFTAIIRALDADGSVPELNYNAACYAALLKAKGPTLAYIATAIRLKPSLRGDAVTDDDLKDYWEDIQKM